eukprot:1971391-Pyramimonas_sp.AAC.1
MGNDKYHDIVGLSVEVGQRIQSFQLVLSYLEGSARAGAGRVPVRARALAGGVRQGVPRGGALEVARAPLHTVRAALQRAAALPGGGHPPARRDGGARARVRHG